jgi:hypothetical protein
LLHQKRIRKKKSLTDPVEIIPFSGQTKHEKDAKPVIKTPAKEIAPVVEMQKEVRVLTSPTGNLKTSYLSIKEMQEQQRIAKVSSGEIEKDKPKKQFTYDDLIMTWKRFAFQCKEEGMDTLYAALSGRDPKVNLETFMITHEIDNTVQKTFLESNEARLMSFLRTELENFSVSLTIVEITGDDSKKLYSGKDKFEDMAKRNPHLQTLQKRFKLDIDF